MALVPYKPHETPESSPPYAWLDGLPDLTFTSRSMPIPSCVPQVLERLSSLQILKISVLGDLSDAELNHYWNCDSGLHLGIRGPGESRVALR